MTFLRHSVGQIRELLAAHIFHPIPGQKISDTYLLEGLQSPNDCGLMLFLTQLTNYQCQAQIPGHPWASLGCFIGVLLVVACRNFLQLMEPRFLLSRRKPVCISRWESLQRLNSGTVGFHGTKGGRGLHTVQRTQFFPFLGLPGFCGPKWPKGLPQKGSMSQLEALCRSSLGAG